MEKQLNSQSDWKKLAESIKEMLQSPDAETRLLALALLQENAPQDVLYRRVRRVMSNFIYFDYLSNTGILRLKDLINVAIRAANRNGYNLYVYYLAIDHIICNI